MEGYERDQYLMEDYEKDHIEGSEAEVQADADAREDKIDKLKKIIQEAWNEGDRLIAIEEDTFGAFLERAAKAIQDAGYQKAETIGEVFAKAKKRPDLVFPPEYYELTTDELGDDELSEPAAGAMEKIIEAVGTKAEGRLLVDKNTVVLCQEFLCKIFNQTSTFLEFLKALKRREEK